ASQVEPARTHLVQLRLAEPVPAAPGERFVIRGSISGLADGRLTTLGGGRVLSVGNVRLRRQRPWVIESLSRRSGALDDGAAWLGVHLEEAREALSPGELASRADVPAELAGPLLEQLQASGQAVPVAGGLIHADVLDAIGQTVLSALEKFHADSPLR